MPRVNLSDAEAQMIENFRRKNATALAHNRAIDLACGAVREHWSSLPLNADGREAMCTILENLKEVIRETI